MQNFQVIFALFLTVFAVNVQCKSLGLNGYEKDSIAEVQRKVLDSLKKTAAIPESLDDNNLSLSETYNGVLSGEVLPKLIKNYFH